MTKTLLSGGLLAGAVAGLVAAILQLWLIQPLIIEAERYETGVLVLPDAASRAPDSGPEPAVTDPSADPGLARYAFTALFLVLTWSGFGLLAAAAVAAANRFAPGASITAFGVALAGFATVALAPGLGLPPELPGMPAADLEARQFWWLGASLATAAALAVALRFRSLGGRVAAVALAASPHLLGAPVPPLAAATVPPDLAALYVARVLGASFLGWLVLGTVLNILSDPSTNRPSVRPVAG